MKEILFLVEEAPEGGYTARAVGQSIFDEANRVAHAIDHERERRTSHR
jgi:hypothetical protein